MSESVIDLFQRALPPAEELSDTPASEEATATAERLTDGAREFLGSGIDPNKTPVALEDFVRAIRSDPVYLPAYEGLVKVARLLAARATPQEGEDLLATALRWFKVVQARLGRLQDSQGFQALTVRLREGREEAKARPRASESEPVAVKLERDAEGRVLAQRRKRLRFRPSSGELRALVPISPAQAPDEQVSVLIPIAGLLLLIAGGVTWYLSLLPTAVGGILLGVGILLLGLRLLAWSGQVSNGVAPGVIVVVVLGTCITVASRIDPEPLRQSEPDYPKLDRWLGNLPDLTPQLEVGAPQTASGLGKMVIVQETGWTDRPLKIDALHDRLPDSARAESPDDLGPVVVARRLTSKAGPLLLVWVIDPEEQALLARAAFTNASLPELEAKAVRWLIRQRTKT